ncbi:MAG: carboxypeptidase-like regulatory domain-containing protein, partial [SAR324 cluster bacterium]
VGVSDALWGSTVATTTSDSNGDFSQASLALGRHSVTYSKSGYLSLITNELLETNGQTINLETVRLLQDNCTSGTMSGKITDAVTGGNMSGVGMWSANGINKKYDIDGGFTEFDDTDSNGAWTLTKDAGWYTIMASKSGYYTDYHNAFACGNQPDQNNSLRATLNEGEMSILLKWHKTNPITAEDLDAHLYIPIIDIDASRNSDCDGAADADDKCHLNYRTNPSGFDYHIYGTGDNVTLDKDHNSSDSNPVAPPGDETMTITKVRSGTYSYSVHNYTDKDNNSGGCCPNYKTNFSKSRATVRVFYNKEGTLVRKDFSVPNNNGTLWRVFTFNSGDSGSGFTRVRTMIYENNRANVY